MIPLARKAWERLCCKRTPFFFFQKICNDYLDTTKYISNQLQSLELHWEIFLLISSDFSHSSPFIFLFYFFCRQLAYSHSAVNPCLRSPLLPLERRLDVMWLSETGSSLSLFKLFIRLSALLLSLWFKQVVSNSQCGMVIECKVIHNWDQLLEFGNCKICNSKALRNCDFIFHLTEIISN